MFLKGRILLEHKIYRVEARFKEAVELTGPDHLYVRETPDKTFIITAAHLAKGVEYILSTQRNSGAPREFVDLGRCVQFAVNLTGVQMIQFNLRPLAESENK